jgi:ABC-type cobalamin/Fe3+-siderophores transport system ATPase subunit
MKMELRANNIQIKAGNTILCQSANLTLAAGETWGVLGPNGSGKTTLLLTLAGLLPINQGTITCNGTPIYYL